MRVRVNFTPPLRTPQATNTVSVVGDFDRETGMVWVEIPKSEHCPCGVFAVNLAGRTVVIPLEVPADDEAKSAKAKGPKAAKVEA